MENQSFRLNRLSQAYVVLQRPIPIDRLTFGGDCGDETFVCLLAARTEWIDVLTVWGDWCAKIVAANPRVRTLICNDVSVDALTETVFVISQFLLCKIECIAFSNLGYNYSAFALMRTYPWLTTDIRFGNYGEMLIPQRILKQNRARRHQSIACARQLLLIRRFRRSPLSRLSVDVVRIIAKELLRVNLVDMLSPFTFPISLFCAIAVCVIVAMCISA